MRRLLRVLGGLGGLGLVGCAACCALPMLGILGIGGGAAVLLGWLEPLFAGLLALGAVAAAVAFVRFRRNRCGVPDIQVASCGLDGDDASCGCGPRGEGM